MSKYNCPQQKVLCNWGMTLKQSSAVHIQALVSADGILPGINSKLQLLCINLASVPGRQLVNSPTAQSLDRWAQPLQYSIMDVIKQMAERFTKNLSVFTHDLEEFDSELNSKLIYINKTSEKLRFLSYAKDNVETLYQKHAKVCTNPNDCGQNKSFEIALYSIQQQYDDYFVQAGGTNTIEKPAMQFFSQGQYFDAFTSIKECVKEAKNSITLIDGYVDADTLAFFPSKDPSITLLIITKSKSINDSFNRAIDLYNKQYENLKVISSEYYHDRFLILDDKLFYHIGASIKDAGNKTFMFSKIEDEDIMNLIRNKLRTELDRATS